MANKIVQLPQPKFDSKTSLEKSLSERRSIRNYRNEPLAISDVSQLLWAAQGITDKRNGFRTAPSAGATYPLEVYIAAGNVSGLKAGVYKYKTKVNELETIMLEDKRKELGARQIFIKDVPLVIIFCAVYERTTGRYGERGIMYVHMEAGHAAQNVALEAISLGLGTVMVGAFDENNVRNILNIPKDETPIYMVPVGKKAK